MILSKMTGDVSSPFPKKQTDEQPTNLPPELEKPMGDTGKVLLQQVKNRVNWNTLETKHVICIAAVIAIAAYLYVHRTKAA